MALASGQRTVPRANITIISADIAKEALPLAFFQPERFIEAHKQEIAFTNGALHLTRDGAVSGRVLSAAVRPAKATRHTAAVLTTYIVFFTVTLLFIIVLFTQVRKSTHTKT
jgi:hypothetical protein